MTNRRRKRVEPSRPLAKTRESPWRTGAAILALLCLTGPPGLQQAAAHVREAEPADACVQPAAVTAWPDGFLNFETPQCNPITLGRGGRVYVIDTPNHRLIEMTRGGAIKRSLRVGLEPAGVAASPDGRTLYVTNHLSDSISVIDARAWRVVHTIEAIDPLTRTNQLDEPCGVVFSPNQPRAYVSVSQPNRLAVLDTDTHRIEKFIDIGGEDPRALAISRDGARVFIAAFESGNQTEVVVPEEEEIYRNTEFWWYEFIENITQTFTSGTAGPIALPVPGANAPTRPDDDVFVLDTATDAVTAIPHVGTLLYGLAADLKDPNTVWVAATAHHNFLNGPEELDGRPISNEVTRLQAPTSDWQAPTRDVVSLDKAAGMLVAGGAVPTSIARTRRGETLVTAGSSDRLVVVDRDLRVRARIAVGSMPRGVVTRGNRAWVYNRGDSSVSIVHLGRGEEQRRVVFGIDPLPAAIAAGRRLFYDARFSSNGTFSCASCHPDGHVDQLVWNLGDGNRTTQTVRGLAGTEEFHWDGSQADAATLIQGGVTGPVFRGSITPCEVDLMARFMTTLSLPPSPFRGPGDLLSESARIGSAIVRRGLWLDENDEIFENGRFDPGFEELFLQIGGEELLPSRGEGCAIAGCHTAPLWTAAGTGGPGFIQAVSFRGMWDRNTWLHDGTSSKIANLEATNEYRTFVGHPEPYAGVANAEASSAAFFTTFFRSHELNGVEDPIALHPHIEAFLRELGTGLPGALGRQVLYDGSPTPEEKKRLWEILTAARAGKVTMRVHGQIAGTNVAWHWIPGLNQFATEQGEILDQEEVRALLQAGPFLVLVTADLPPNTASAPLLRTVVVQGEKTIAEARIGETQTFEFRGSNFAPGMWLLVDGIPYVQLQVIDSQTALHTEDPVQTGPGFFVLSLLNPDGLASNEFPLPVTGAPDPDNLSFVPVADDKGSPFD